MARTSIYQSAGLGAVCSAARVSLFQKTAIDTKLFACTMLCQYRAHKSNWHIKASNLRHLFLAGVKKPLESRPSNLCRYNTEAAFSEALILVYAGDTRLLLMTIRYSQRHRLIHNLRLSNHVLSV